MKRKVPRAALKRIIKGKKEISVSKNVDLVVYLSLMHGLERLAKKASSKAQESNEAVITERHLLSVFQVITPAPSECEFISLLMMLTVLLCLYVLFGSVEGVASLAPDSHCPIWTTPLNGSCKCADSLHRTVTCEDGKGALQMKKCFCMTTQLNDDSTVVGSCLYKCDLHHPTVYSIGTNSSKDLTNKTCGIFNRTGVMCGKCLPNHGLPVYSYSLSCVECSHYQFNWLKYVAVAYIPLSFFYLIVIFFRISATSGYLLGYVTICQMIALKTLGTLIFNATENKKHMIVTVFSAILPIWNLDFFRTLYPPFCLSSHMTVLQVQLLDYIVAVYPMILVLITYALVKLHDRFRLVVYICQPFYKCLHIFRKEWDIKTSLIESFATFYLLSYVKILNTSADILTSTRFFNMNGTYGSTYYYFNGSIPYFGSEHLPYAVLAIAIVSIFNILPLLLLLLYPCLCFHKCLNKTKCSCHVLHVLMDAVLGAYTHRPRERRYFGTSYFILRLVHVLAFATMNPLMYPTALSYSLIIVLLSLAAFTPYRNKWHTLIDTVLFSAFLHSTLMMVYHREGVLVDPAQTHKIRNVYNITGYASITVLPLYGLLLLARKVVPWSRIQSVLTKRVSTRISDGEQSLPYRMEHEEIQPLLH